MAYRKAQDEFEKKYAQEIAGISRRENVDMLVARDMLQANIRNYGNKDAEIYKGAGKADTNKTRELTSDYDRVVQAAKEENSRRSSGGSSYTPSISSPSYGSIESDIQKEIDKLAKAQKQAAIAGLGKSRDSALSALDSEKSSLTPAYRDARNNAAVQNRLSARTLQEYMANRGQQGGVNTQQQLMQNVSLQGALGSLSEQEMMALDDLNRRRSGVESAYASDVASAEAGINAQALQNRISAMQAEQQRQDMLRQQQIQNAYAEAGMTGYLDNMRTLQGQQFDMSNDPNSLENQMRALELQQLQTEGEFLRPTLEAKLASQNALTTQRLAPKSSGSSKLSTSEVNRVVSNISNVISSQVKQLGISPTTTDINQFVNELYPDLSPEAKSKVVRELQGKFGISPNSSQNNTLRGPINPSYLLQSGKPRSW